MKLIFSTLVFLYFCSGIHAQSDKSPEVIPKKGISLSDDVGVLILGGIGAHANWYHKNLFLGVGFYRFPSSPEFGGYDPKFNLFVDYIFGAQAGWYIWPGNKKGLYLAMIYHFKRQDVTEVASGMKVSLYSHLIGLELGYDWNLWGPIFVTPRVGALYYVQSPQGSSGAPVLVGNSYYDNPNHKIFDLYYTISIGINIDFKKPIPKT